MRELLAGGIDDLGGEFVDGGTVVVVDEIAIDANVILNRIEGEREIGLIGAIVDWLREGSEIAEGAA